MANKNLKKSLQDRVKEFSISLPLMEGREKGDFSRLHGETVSIADYGFMKDDNKEYVAFVVKEDPQYFYFGGQVLTDNMRQLDEDGYSEEIRKDGLPVLFQTKKSKNKREYTTVDFYPEA
jgi:hypothetical protein